MARGAKLNQQAVYNIMASYALTENFCKTAEELGIPVSTVRDTIYRNRGKEEFAKVREQKKEEFSVRASKIINKGLTLLERRLDTAINHEESLAKMIDEIYATKKEELSQDEKSRLVTQIRMLQVQKMGDITTAIGTLYDKRALALGESTENITYKLPPEIKQYAE